MASDVRWITTASSLKLAIMARPRAGDWLADEIDHWKREGVELVVSLLESDEVEELGLRDEAELCRASAIEFISHPIVDRGTPEDQPASIELAKVILESGKPAAINCRSGIGRASLMAALVLRLGGMSVDAAFRAIGEARGLEVPDTDAQREWITKLTLPTDLRGPTPSD